MTPTARTRPFESWIHPWSEASHRKPKATRRRPSKMVDDFLPIMHALQPPETAETCRRLDPSAPSAPRPSSTVVRNGRNILNPAYHETCPSQHSDGCLSPSPWGPSAMTPRGPHPYVESSYPLVPRNPCGSGSRLHRCVWRTLESVSFHMLAARTPRNSFGPTKVCNMNNRVIERRVDVGYTPSFNLLFCYASSLRLRYIGRL